MNFTNTMNIKKFISKHRLTLLCLLTVSATYLFFPSRPYYKKSMLRVTTPPSLNLEKEKLHIFDGQKKDKIVYRLLSHDYEEEILNFSPRFFCFDKKTPETKIWVNSIFLPLKENVNDKKCPYGAEYTKEVDVVPPHDRVVLMTEIMGLILRIIFGFGLIHLIRYYFYGQSRTFKLLFPFLLSIQFFILFLSNPGKLEIDFQKSLHIANSHLTWDWFSVPYSFFIKAIVQIIDSTYPLVLIQCTAFSLLMAFVASIYRKATSHYWPIILITVISFLPAISFFNTYISRDWYFMFFIQVCFFISFSKMAIDRKIVSTFDHILIGGAVVILYSIRREFLPQAIFFMFLIFFNIIRIKYKKSLCFLIVLISFSIHLAIKPFNHPKTFHEKILNSLSHPISSILTSGFNSHRKARDIERISEFYDYQKLIKFHTEYEIMHIHKGALKHFSTSEIYSFYGFSVIFFLKNFDTFISSRIKMMGHMYLSRIVRGYPNDFYYCQSNDCKKMINVNHLVTITQHKGAAQIGRRIFDMATNKYRLLVFNALIVFLFLVGVLFFYRKAPFSALLSSLLLLRQGVLFLLAPAAYFKYIMPMYLGGCLCLILFVFELSRRKIADSFTTNEKIL